MRLLLLAGTPEAVEVSHALARDRRIQAVAALESASRTPPGLPLPMRIGGWSDPGAMAEWLKRRGVDAVLDMTHPFATTMTDEGVEACDQLGIPFVQFLRPALVPGEDDQWFFLNSEAEAASYVPSGDTVFLSTGRHRLSAFMGLGDRPIYVRVREPGRDVFPFARGRFVHRPERLPVSTEIAGLQAFDVRWMVARNTGGAWTQPMLDAARLLGIPVGMIRRPLQPQVPKVSTVAAAIGWARRNA